MLEIRKLKSQKEELELELEEAQKTIAACEKRVRSERTRIDVAALDGNLAGDAATAAKVQALTNLHQQKTTALMKTINMQKDKISKLERSSKEHKRSKMVQRQDRKLKEMELAVDVMKSEVVRPTMHAPTTEKVNDWLTKKTTGGPLRFRPKTREELQNEVLQLQQRNSRLERRLEKAKAVNREQARQPIEPPTEAWGETGKSTMGDTHNGSGSNGSNDSERVRELLEQVELLNVAVASRDLNLRSHLDEMERLHGELREMRLYEDQHARLERKYRQRKQELEEVKHELAKASEQTAREKSEANIAREELQMFKAEVQRDVDEQEEQLAQEREQSARLTQDCFELKQELVEAQKALRERHEGVKSKSRHELGKEKAAKQATHNLHRIEGELDAERRDRDRMERELEDAREKIEALQQRHAEDAAERGRLESQLLSAQSSSAEAMGSAQQGAQQFAGAAREQVVKLEQKLEQYEDELAKADQEIEQLESMASELQQELAEAREAQARAEQQGGQREAEEQGREPAESAGASRAQAQEAAASRNKLVLQIKDLEERLADAEEMRDRAEESIRKLKAQNTELIRWKTVEHQQLVDEKEKLTKKLNAANLLRRRERQQY